MTPDEYAARAVVSVPLCNLCGRPGTETDPIPERFGFPARTRQCWECGLLWLDPRMNAESYRQFYADGSYRRLVKEHGGWDHAKMLDGQQTYARYLQSHLAAFEGFLKGKSLLDIGGSTGVVAKAMADRFGMSATVLEPSEDEGRQCLERGVDWAPGTIETFRPVRKWDVIMLCQTVEHLMDISAALETIRHWMTPSGVLFVDIVDVSRQWAISGKPRVKIDHLWYLIPHTMRAYLMRAGFNPIFEGHIESWSKSLFLCDRFGGYSFVPDRTVTREFFKLLCPRERPSVAEPATRPTMP